MKKYLFTPLVSLLFGQAFALNYTGHVTDKLEYPVEAKICVQYDPDLCTTSDYEDGYFHLTDEMISIQSAKPNLDGFQLHLGSQDLTLSSPLTSMARLLWTNAEGKVVSPEINFRIAQGKNTLSIPQTIQANGLYFIRLTISNRTLTWKALIFGSSRSATRMTERVSTPSTLALSKVSEGPSALEVTASGYQDFVFWPDSDSGVNLQFVLRETDDSDLVFKTTYLSKILTLDTATKKLVLVKWKDDCLNDSNALIPDTTTQNYAIDKDNEVMYWWETNHCTGQAFQGLNATPIGTWTMDRVSIELPPELQSEDCVTNPERFVENFQNTVTITDSSLKEEASRDLCPSYYYEGALATLFEKDSTIYKSKNNCKDLRYSNFKSDSAIFIFSDNKDSLVTTFTFKNKTCRLAEKLTRIGVEQPCLEDYDPFSKPFYTCVSASGFSELDLLSMMTPKQSMSTRKKK